LIPPLGGTIVKESFPAHLPSFLPARPMILSTARRLLLPAFLVTVFALPCSTTFGQAGGGDDENLGNPIAGIDVDASGVLAVRQFDPRLAKERLAAARAAGADQEVMRESKLRKVSLRRLEAAIEAAKANGDTLPDELLAMAGLTSVKYVFYYPDTQDIVIAGPAEGYFADPTGRFVGIQSGSPSVLLEDWVTAMRAFAPGQRPTGVISVSIDPTPEGLQRMEKFLVAARRNLRPGDAENLAAGLKNNLGLQTVTFKGIPDTTHFARVLVEADYRMKLIGIGLERLPVPVKSYIERANPSSVAANAMERWYFQPNYDGVAVSDDSLAMQIKERGVQLVGENERVAAGNRIKGGRVNKASQAFCKDFSEKYNEIAKRVRIYAELRQLIDVSIAAAYIQEQDFYTQANWTAPVLMDESVVSVQTYTAPEQVETAVNAIWRGNTLMTPLGGGVHMRPTTALTSEHKTVDTSGETVSVMKEATPTDLAEGQWWWD
jgi:Protein of unknown function (DUF1598)